MDTTNKRNSNGCRVAKSCKILLALVFIVIVILGILAAVIGTTFKNPDISVQSVRSLGQANISPTEISMQWQLTVQVSNQNEYRLDVTGGSVGVYFNVAPTVEIGRGQLPSSGLSVSSKSNTTFDLPLLFQWSSGSSTISSQDSAAIIGQLLKSCQSSAGAPDIPMTIALNGLWVKLNGVGPLPVPQLKQSTSQRCPVQLDSLLASNLPAGLIPASFI